MRIEMVPLKHLATINDDTLSEDTDPERSIRYLDIGAVGRGFLVEQPASLRFGDAPSRARRRVQSGDTIVSTVRTYLRSIWAVEGPTDDLIVSTGFAVVRPRDVEPRYLRWAVQSDTFVEEVVARSTGVSYPAINPSDLATIEIWRPASEQQRCIADLLDAETIRVDALIAAKKRMISSLTAKRAGTIFAGVTGLTLPSERSPSRLTWSDTLPAHWREARLALLASLGSGHTPSRSRPEWWADCKIPWVTTGEVAQMRSDRIEYLTDTREKISEIGLANSSAELHPRGTVVLCRTAASAGYSAIMGSDMAVSQDIATWTCADLMRPRYLLLCLRAMRPDLLGRLAMGSTHKTIYMPDIGSIRIPVPPVEEQDEIVDHVWRELAQIDSIADTLARQIELLKERRQALITAAVTGELDI